MKYLFQLGIVCIVTFAGEILHAILPLPVPASIYGLLFMLFLLMTKCIKLEQVEDIADFFLSIMPIMFLPASIGLVIGEDVFRGQAIPVICMVVFSTLAVLIVTGLVAQTVIRIQIKRKEEKKHE